MTRRAVLVGDGFDPEGSALGLRPLAGILRRAGWECATIAGPESARLEALDAALAEGGPEVVVAFEDGRWASETLERVRRRGVIGLLIVGSARDSGLACSADPVLRLATSGFIADFIRKASGRDCEVLPPLVDFERVVADRNEPNYLTFVDPTPENGVYAFARIADELGKRRPDLPILVVEGRGTEADVAACGLDLRRHGNVFFMPAPSDSKGYWAVTRVGLVPMLWWEHQGTAAVEAIVNGIPAVASDRGDLTETLGGSGVVLPLPDRITPATRWLPEAEEVEPWVGAILRLWDEPEYYESGRRKAAAEARRWSPEVVHPKHVDFFEGLAAGRRAPEASAARRPDAVVLVPYQDAILPECEAGLRALEREGVRVVRRGGCSAIDVARNDLASETLHEGIDALLFVDSDIGFDPRDALRLLARPEPVVAGIYAKKGRRELASRFLDGIDEVRFGANAPGPYPLQYAATGFLRVRCSALRTMVERLGLPLCNARRGRGVWPFFRPEVVPDGEGHWRYLAEDWAFSHRLDAIGVTPMADTSIRLWHHGRHPFGWEDAGAERARFDSYRYRIVAPTA